MEQIAKTVHGDHQALWIDPTNSKYILNGSDGGFQRSFDGGDSWKQLTILSYPNFIRWK